MIYTDIQNNSTTDLALVKTHLRVDSFDTSLDPILSLYLATAKQEADNYCQDVFPVVPPTIEAWILQSVSYKYNRNAPNVKLEDFRNLGRVEWDVDNYDDYVRLLKPYRREVGFF